MKIGLVGEAPNDTTAIQNLLSRRYPYLDFVTLLDRIHGSMLDNRKSISRLLRIEYEVQEPDIIIFIRDLDALESDKKKKSERKDVFSSFNSVVNKTGIFLLNIYELETLILADIQTFNHHYGTAIAKFDDPMRIIEPKEVLIIATKGFSEQFKVTHNPILFTLLNFDTVKQNCRYFSTFIKKFDKFVKV